MKKGIKITALLLSMASLALAQGEVTLSIIGITRVEKPAGALNLVGNCFEDTLLNDLAPANMYNGDISAGNADTIYIWNPQSLGYAVYSVYDERAYLGPSGKVEWRDFNNFGGSAVNPVIPSGCGFWLSAQGSATDTNVFFSGNVVVSQSVTNELVAGLQMISYPFSTDVDLNETLLSDSASGDISAGNADKIYVWDSDAQTYVTYALYDERAYLGPSGNVEWRYFDSFNVSASNTTVNLSKGFWYDATGSFTWIETNKYYNSL